MTKEKIDKELSIIKGLMEKEDYEGALKKLKLFFIDNPLNSVAFNYRGEANLALVKGLDLLKIDDAILDFTKAIELDPNNIDAINNKLIVEDILEELM